MSVTTTHVLRGSGRPRLIFATDGETHTRDQQREFDLRPSTTPKEARTAPTCAWTGSASITPRYAVTTRTSTFTAISALNRKHGARPSRWVRDASHRRHHCDGRVVDVLLPRRVRPSPRPSPRRPSRGGPNRTRASPASAQRDHTRRRQRAPRDRPGRVLPRTAE